MKFIQQCKIKFSVQESSKLTDTQYTVQGWCAVKNTHMNGILHWRTAMVHCTATNTNNKIEKCIADSRHVPVYEITQGDMSASSVQTVIHKHLHFWLSEQNMRSKDAVKYEPPSYQRWQDRFHLIDNAHIKDIQRRRMSFRITYFTYSMKISEL
jgi:hypothetical protein